MHDLETKITLLSNENRLLTQKVGSQGLGEATLSKRLAEKSKEFDDLAAELREMKASQRVVENRIREEVSEMQQDNLRLRSHAEQAQAEIIRLNVVIKECDTVITKQKQLIGDLEKSKADDGRLPDHNYILRTESDLMMDALRRQLMAEFESQKKAQASSFVTELAANMRNFNDEWKCGSSLPQRSGRIRGLSFCQGSKLPMLRKSDSRLESSSSKQSFRTGQKKMVTNGGQARGQIMTRKALVNHVLVTE